MSEQEGPLNLKVKEAAGRLYVSRGTMRRWADKRCPILGPNSDRPVMITAMRVGPRNDRRIDTAALDSQGFDGRQLLTTKEAANLLGVHPNTLRNWHNKGLLRAFRVGSRGDRRFDVEVLKKLVRTT